MSEMKSEQGTPSLLAGWSLRRRLFRRPVLNSGQRIAYAAVSFLLGITYLKVLILLEFHISPAMLVFSILGGLCFTVCILNLVAIWQENN
jgi:hypothetical protein